MQRLESCDQKQWRQIRNTFLLDPFYGYTKGNFSEDEKCSPSKLTLDFIGMFDKINEELKEKLTHYETIVKTLTKEKNQLDASLARCEAQVREERNYNSSDKTELKTARGTIQYLENLVEEKNKKITELHRETNVQLWEREKERLFQESEKKIQALEQELADQKKQREGLTKRLSNMDESSKLMKMRQEMNRGILPPRSPSSVEELKRSIYLLEKDVIFLEQELYRHQRMFATVLLGLKTDLVIISDNLTDPDTGQCVDKDFVRLCELTNIIYTSMVEADLQGAQKKLPPHYTYLPNDFKIKRIKRVSKTNPLPPVRGSGPPNNGHTPPVANPEPNFEKTDADSIIVENPQLIDRISKEVNTTACMRHFPHLSHEFVKDHWIKFKEFDNDGNECLDFSEVVKALTSMGLKFTAKQAEEAMTEADVNRSHTLDFYEYLLVADKLFSRKGQSELFHTQVDTANRKVMAKTCAVQ